MQKQVVIVKSSLGNTLHKIGHNGCRLGTVAEFKGSSVWIKNLKMKKEKKTDIAAIAQDGCWQKFIN